LANVCGTKAGGLSLRSERNAARTALPPNGTPSEPPNDLDNPPGQG